LDDGSGSDNNKIIVGTTIPSSRYDRNIGWHMMYLNDEGSNGLILAKFDDSGNPVDSLSANASKSIDIKMDDGNRMDGYAHALGDNCEYDLEGGECRMIFYERSVAGGGGGDNENTVVCEGNPELELEGATVAWGSISDEKKAEFSPDELKGKGKIFVADINCNYSEEDPYELDISPPRQNDYMYWCDKDSKKWEVFGEEGNKRCGIPYHILWDGKGSDLIYFVSGSTDCFIDWGDGTDPEICPKRTVAQHTYGETKDYHIKVHGKKYPYNNLNPGTMKNVSVKAIYHLGKWEDASDITSLIVCMNCPNLVEISGNMLKYFPNILDGTMFFTETKLTSIPTGLFQHNIKIASFTGVFANGNLESIPDDLFRYNTKVTNFTAVFSGNSNLKCDDIKAAAKYWPAWETANKTNATSKCKE
jgi:hypothetical protein